MHLVLFDIDGTLTVSDGIGRACYLSALAEEFGITDAERDWGSYREVTDTGITREILEERLGTEPDEEHIARQHRAYHRRLRDALRSRPRAYEAVAGSHEALAGLRGRSEYRVGIASGNWREAGWMKLASAAFPGMPLPSGYADDAIEKHAIIAAAVEAARREAGGEFDRVVYVGDASWDVRAAASANVAFVGVGVRHRELRERGASVALPDYLDTAAFERALERATVPEV